MCIHKAQKLGTLTSMCKANIILIFNPLYLREVLGKWWQLAMCMYTHTHTHTHTHLKRFFPLKSNFLKSESHEGNSFKWNIAWGVGSRNHYLEFHLFSRKSTVMGPFMSQNTVSMMFSCYEKPMFNSFVKIFLLKHLTFFRKFHMVCI